jgi:hypothetical protein
VSITFPDTVDTIDDIRSAIGRYIEIFIVTSSIPCDICNLDPVTNTSTNSFCPACSGAYWIPIYSGANVKAHVTWGKSDEISWYTGGMTFDGDCRLQIKYTSDNLDLVDNAEYIIVDSKKVEIRDKTLRGVQQLNRIIIDCIESEKEA